ncbi:MAG: ribbon-helix-helix domain-containing protein [Firmicutes bacterium]|nr:ribbon-helix-helix domain-containing protein [Bacillota bacterium]
MYNINVYISQLWVNRMERTQIYLTSKQKDALIALSREKEIPMAELIRMAIDEYLNRHHQDNRRQVLLDTFGAVSEWNSTGEEYTRMFRAGWRSALKAAEEGEIYGVPD